jgi:type IV pilus assembly protein PilX
MTAVRTQRPRPSHAKGVVLIVTLFVLVLLTLVTLASIRGTLMDEKMAGHSRDRNKALQAAEAALRDCLRRVSDSTFSPIKTPAAPTSAALWDVEANWSDDTVSVEVALVDAGLAANPRCMVEDINASGGGTLSYRVTSRAVGGSADSLVVLQATYSNE